MAENADNVDVREPEKDTMPPAPQEYLLERYLAKLIDFIIAGALFTSFKSPVGPVAGLTYILIADGLKGGQSLGKRLTGLRTISIAREGLTCDFRESIIRNLIFALLFVAYLLIGWIPYLGKVLVAVVGIAVIVCEAALIYNDEKGMRFGDRLAETMVVAVEE